MREISKPVIKFLRDFDRVRDTHDSVEQQLDEISFVSTRELVQGLGGRTTATAFDPPRLELPKQEQVTGISYRRPVAEVTKAKRLLGVTTNRDVGVRTFEYFLEAEDEE